MSDWIAQACTAGARLAPAGTAIGLTPRTLQRWRQAGAITADARRREHRAADAVRLPANRLSQAERETLLNVANQPEFAHLCPHQLKDRPRPYKPV